MNIYFLLEGKRTEKKVYPSWITILLPFLTRIQDPYAVEKNNYYVFSAEGYPAVIENDLINAILEVNSIGKYNYLVVCLDADDDDIEAKIDVISENLRESNITLNNCKLIPIVQQCCIESWFLGNKRIFSRNPQGEFVDFASFYNVSIEDPEVMQKPGNFLGTKSGYHHEYLKAMLQEKQCRYSKVNPGVVCDQAYLKQLIKRIKDTGDLNSLKTFIQFCEEVRKLHDTTLAKLI